MKVFSHLNNISPERLTRVWRSVLDQADWSKILVGSEEDSNYRYIFEEMLHTYLEQLADKNFVANDEDSYYGSDDYTDTNDEDDDDDDDDDYDDYDDNNHDSDDDDDDDDDDDSAGGDGSGDIDEDDEDDDNERDLMGGQYNH